MSYRPVPDPLSNPPAGRFAAVATQNVWVEKRPNWIQRNFTPLPFVYLDYGKLNEDCRLHFFAVGTAFTLMCCGWGFVGAGLLVIWSVLMILGFSGLFHRGIESMDWEESR